MGGWTLTLCTEGAGTGSEKEGSTSWESYSRRHTGAPEMKPSSRRHWQQPDVPVPSLCSVRADGEVELLEPMLGPRVCTVGTGTSMGRDPRIQNMLRPW